MCTISPVAVRLFFDILVKGFAKRAEAVSGVRRFRNGTDRKPTSQVFGEGYKWLLDKGLRRFEGLNRLKNVDRQNPLLRCKTYWLE
jgi:hypothetical protein